MPAPKKTEFSLVDPPEAFNEVPQPPVKEFVPPKSLSKGSLGFVTQAITGKRIDISAYGVDHSYIPSSGKSFYGDAVNHMIDPLPGAMYVWAGISNLHKRATMARIRSGQYRVVEVHELKPESDLPFDIHKILTRTNEPEKQVVCIADLILCEVHPKAVKELYIRPVADAAARVAEESILSNVMNNYQGGQMAEMLSGLDDPSHVQVSITQKDRNMNL